MSFFFQKGEKSIVVYQMFDSNRFDILVLIIFFGILIYLFTRCAVKCGTNGELFGAADMSSSLSSMGWASGRPAFYPDVEFGDLGLYYVENPVNGAEARELANSLGGIIASEWCINSTLHGGYESINTPTPNSLYYNPNPTISGYLVSGQISNGGRLLPDPVLIGEDNAVRNGVFIYGPVPEGIGKLIASDPDGKSSATCLRD